VDGEGLLVSLAAANNGRYAVGASTTSTSILGVTASTKYGLVTVEVTNETGKNNGISVVGYSASPEGTIYYIFFILFYKNHN